MDTTRAIHVQQLAKRFATPDRTYPLELLRDLTMDEQALFEMQYRGAMRCHREALCADRFMSGRSTIPNKPKEQG